MTETEIRTPTVELVLKLPARLVRILGNCARAETVSLAEWLLWKLQEAAQMIFDETADFAGVVQSSPDEISELFQQSMILNAPAAEEVDQTLEDLVQRVELMNQDPPPDLVRRPTVEILDFARACLDASSLLSILSSNVLRNLGDRELAKEEMLAEASR